jgi:hypothetical protein
MEIGKMLGAASGRVAGAIEPALEEGPLGPVFRAAHDAARGAGSAIAAARAKLEADLAEFAGALATAARELGVAHEAEEERYHAFMARADANRARVAERHTLHLRLEELSARKRRVDEWQRALVACEAARVGVLKEKERLVLAVQGARKATAARLEEALAGAMKVTVDGGGDSAGYEEFVGAMLRGCGVRPDTKAIVAAFRPARLAAVARAGDPAPLEAVDRSKTGKAERAAKILAALAGSGQLAELAAFRPLDIVRLELMVHKKPIDSKIASVGQRCTCVIEILLLPSPASLLMDQVEDHLDGSFIYNTLVRKIRAEKPHRQFIVVSHAPNIPALAEAEQVVLLGLDETGSSHVAAEGDYVAMARRLEEWLEGGAEAFIRRGQLYGHFPRPLPKADGET